MGRVGKLLSFVRALRGDAKVSDVKVDRGGADNRTPQHFSDAGDDSFPLPSDYAALVDQEGTGRDSAVGYIDPKNEQKATAGDKRVYARDPTTGAQVVEVWLKSDGSATTENANGSSTLRSDGSQIGQNSLGSYELRVNGDFVVNGVTIAANGVVTIPTSLILATKEIAGHAHAQANDSGGNTEEDTGANQ